jgi:hypothetical protein
MILERIHCPRCDEIEVIKHGKTALSMPTTGMLEREIFFDYSYEDYLAGF